MRSATGDGKQRIVEAVWRIVARGGMSEVSVRAVAAEAGVTGGTVQHHYPTRALMVHHAMETLAERFTERLAAVPRSSPPREWTRAILLELLPLNAERNNEFRVWLAFTTHATADPGLAELKRRFAAELRRLYHDLLRARGAAAVGGTVAADHAVDPHPEREASEDLDTAVLQAVLDGLALQLADMDPAEAAALGPALLDHYLANAVDPWTAAGSPTRRQGDGTPARQ